MSFEETAWRADAPQQLRRQTEALSRLRDGLTRFLGTGNLEASVVLGRSVSELMSVLAFGIPSSLHARRIVLVGRVHPSVVLAWSAAAECYGTEVVRRDVGDAQSVDGASVVVVSHVDHISGSEFDITPVIEWGRSSGAVVIVDGAQAVGRVHVNLADVCPDVYVASGRKTLLAPMGTAFMSVADKVLAEISPSVWSTRSAMIRDDGGVEIADGASRLEGNLPDLSALAGLEANIGLWTPDVVTGFVTQMDQLLPRLVDRMETAGLEPLAGIPGARNAGIMTFRLPSAWNGLDLQDHLFERGIVIAATQTEVRISLHFANRLDDIDRFGDEVLRYAA